MNKYLKNSNSFHIGILLNPLALTTLIYTQGTGFVLIVMMLLSIVAALSLYEDNQKLKSLKNGILFGLVTSTCTMIVSLAAFKLLNIQNTVLLSKLLFTF